MKALILNSGTGSRMGDSANTIPKCMTMLCTGETILSRQLRQLSEAGTENVIITTGFFDEKIKEHCNDLKAELNLKNLNLTFCKNDLFDTTNYIYSIYLARHLLDDNLLLLHGDLVFDFEVLSGLMNQNGSNIIVSSAINPLPLKDFKAVVKNSEVKAVGVDFFESAVAALPLYKLEKEHWRYWLANIVNYCETGRRSCYAENALNDIIDEVPLYPYDVKSLLCAEIDTLADLYKVNARLIKEVAAAKKLFVVHGSAYINSAIQRTLNSCDVVLFNDYTPNPCFEDVCKAVEVFKANKCNAVLAVGGGSAMDVAKCVKIFSSLEQNDYLDEKKYKDNGVPLIAIPTTAGTGSESTHFSVIYKDGIKLSVTHESIIPCHVGFVPEVLDGLPMYHKKAAFLDALCQSIESWWSVNSTNESIEYAKKSIEILLGSYKSFLSNDNSAGNNFINEDMLLGANYSGRAINITQTTAPHALSYKLTSDCGLPHGIAVALCLPNVWEYMLNNPQKTQDVRGSSYVSRVFIDIANALGYNSVSEAIDWFRGLLCSLEIQAPVLDDTAINNLTQAVNIQRLGNSPILFDEEAIKKVYKGVSA
jgi:alcohol dehydrogenase class IV